MPGRYVVEMLMDRIAASKIYKGDAYTDRSPLEYFLAAKDRSWYIHPVTLQQMEFLLTMWAERGEDYTVNYIRRVFLRKDGRRKGGCGKS